MTEANILAHDDDKYVLRFENTAAVFDTLQLGSTFDNENTMCNLESNFACVLRKCDRITLYVLKSRKIATKSM